MRRDSEEKKQKGINKLDKDRDRNRAVRLTNNVGVEGGKKRKRYGGEERRREQESRRRSAAHRGLILTFLSGPGLPCLLPDEW